MKNNQDIDRLIQEALNEDERELFHQYDEQGMFGMIGGLFKGRMKWLNALTAIIQVTMVGFAFYFAFLFFSSSEPTEMIRFGSIFFTLLIAITTLKIFHMLEMYKNATVREIKRMEFQVSILANKLSKKEA